MKRQIGIVTYCQGTNFGSILQAFAMKNILNKKGFEVYFLVNKNSKINAYKLFVLLKYLFIAPNILKNMLKIHITIII